MKNNKKLPLYIALFALDAIITIFLLVVAIIMLARAAQGLTPAQIADLPEDNMINYFQKHPTVYGWTCVVPLFVLLIANIVVLFLYVRKTSKKEAIKVNDLTDEEKEALKQELLNELKEKKE